MTKPRTATPTVSFVDEYCALYQTVFPDVRSLEQFTYLQVGMLSDLKRKTLPAIARAVQEADPQALHHFLANAPWSVADLRNRRVEVLRQALGGASFTLCIDETGDKKKGKTTDYVAHQYIGNLGKLANGIVSVNAYGVLRTMTFPLLFKIYKPQTRLKPNDQYKSKPELAIELIRELRALGFSFDVVLADSLYGESSAFIAELDKFHLKYVVAIRSNHAVWVGPGQRVRRTRWRTCDRIFWNGEKETRYIREIIFGVRRSVRFYEITTDPLTEPIESTWWLMTNLDGKIEQTLGNTYGLRTWIEYGFKHAKNELGWADYRVTDYATIERWWEVVMCAYLLVSLQSPVFTPAEEATGVSSQERVPARFREHRWWDEGQGWKNLLNNLRLVLQPYIFHCLLIPWLLVFELPSLQTGFADLIRIMNTFHAALPT